MKVKTEWRSNDGAFGIWRRIFSQRQRETNLLHHADNGIAQRFSKSGLRTGRELNPDPPQLRISSALVSLRPPCVAHTHTERGRMNQCCSVYWLFYKTKRIATSDIFKLSFSRIMSPVSPREREVSPSRRSLSPPAELAAHSKNRTAADLWMNEYKTAFPKTYHCWLSGHMNMSVVRL